MVWPLLIALGALIYDGCTSDDEEVTAEQAHEYPDVVGPVDIRNNDSSDSSSSDSYTCKPKECSSGVSFPLKNGDSYCLEFTEQDPAQYGLRSQSKLKGITTVDVNGDGKKDIYVRTEQGTDQVLEWKQGKYVPSSIALPYQTNTQAVAAHDYDEDGDVDLVVAGDSGTEIFTQDHGQWNRSEEAPGMLDPQVGKSVEWLGNDVVLATDSGLRYYCQNPDHSFTDCSQEKGIQDINDGSKILVHDDNGDGLEDILVVNGTGANRHFRGKNDGTFESIEDQTLGFTPGFATDVNWVPLNENEPDVLHITNYDSQDLVLQPNGESPWPEVSKDLGLQNPGKSMRAAWTVIPGVNKPMAFIGRYQQPNLVNIPEIDPETGKVPYFSDHAFDLGINETGNTVDAQWLDINDDEKMDLVVVMADGSFRVFMNESEVIQGCEETLF